MIVSHQIVTKDFIIIFFHYTFEWTLSFKISFVSMKYLLSEIWNLRPVYCQVDFDVDRQFRMATHRQVLIFLIVILSVFLFVIYWRRNPFSSVITTLIAVIGFATVSDHESVPQRLILHASILHFGADLLYDYIFFFMLCTVAVEQQCFLSFLCYFHQMFNSFR